MAGMLLGSVSDGDGREVKGSRKRRRIDVNGVCGLQDCSLSRVGRLSS